MNNYEFGDPRRDSAVERRGSLSRLDRFAVAGIAVGVLLLAYIFPSPFLWWGLAGSALLAIRGTMTDDKELRILSLLIPILLLLTGPGLAIASKLTPRTIDAALSSADFGFSVACLAYFRAHQLLWNVFVPIYYALPLWVCVVLCFVPYPMRLMKQMVISGILAVPLFLLFPAVGPAWVHDPRAPRNCLPSLHVAWALMLVWQGGPKWLRVSSGIFLVLTAISTVGLGEHYVADVVAAVPFTVAVIWLEGKCQAVRFFAQAKAAPPPVG